MKYKLYFLAPSNGEGGSLKTKEVSLMERSVIKETTIALDIDLLL